MYFKQLSIATWFRKERNGINNIQTAKITATGPITSWQIDGEKMETVRDFILEGGRSKIMQMVTEVMKLKDACSLEEKLWPT